jgi:hypothetical protein
MNEKNKSDWFSYAVGYFGIAVLVGMVAAAVCVTAGVI